MNIILWIIFGGLAGWLGSEIIDTDLNLLGNIVVGILGAFIGGWLAGKLGAGRGGDRPTTVKSFAWAVVGSVILLAIINLLS